MASIQARVLYDFVGDTANGELSIIADDYLTVLRQDIGDGWWDAEDASGNHGLIPMAYVEMPPSVDDTDHVYNTPDAETRIVTSLPEPTMPPPPAPMVTSWDAPEYNSQPIAPAYVPPSQQPQLQSQPSDDWDDDWDDDDDDSTIPDQESGGSSYSAGNKGVQIRDTGSKADGNRFGTARGKGFSRFSTFAKSGGEAYLLGTSTGAPSDAEKVRVVDGSHGPCWESGQNPFTCVVASPKKENKYKGLKSFICYQLTPSFSNIQVSRRYKHFDWLHKILCEKFPCVATPPIPDKQVTGRYEDEFISERMRLLQLWLNRMVRHPVIANSAVLLHFLTCTDEKRWKVGKRAAEKDEFQGAKFFLAVHTPATPLDLNMVENNIETFTRFTKSMDDGVRHLLGVTENNMKKHQGPFKREFQKIGHSIESLAATFDIDTGVYSQKLTTAMKHTGKTYDEIGQLFAAQPVHDLYPTMETLSEYKGILSCWPEMIQIHKGSLAKVKECQKSQDEGKMSESEVQSVINRSDTVSYAIMSEQNYFQEERVRDFKLMMQIYLRQQIEFYKKITSKLEDSLHLYESA
ncbi:sorting nexin-33-like [Lineus longissimus]|uniref:sorting nexin-33-like n=1 Tax=Lineus longissimus TaxID=88925 RepID=UPI00315D5DC0